MLEGLIRFGEAGVGGFVGVSYIFLLRIRFDDSDENALTTHKKCLILYLVKTILT